MKKTPFINTIFLFLILLTFLSHCSKYSNDQITEIEKLSSPNNEYDAYFYNIESGMSFGSNVNALQIVKYQEKPDFCIGDFFRVPNSRPFQIKWENNNLTIKTISHAVNSAEKQPFKTEIQNYKGVNIKNMIYTTFGGTAISDFRFKKFYEKNGNLIFTNETDSLIFNEANSQIHIDKNYIEINFFEQNKFEKNKGLYFDGYKLIPQSDFNIEELKKYQPLEKIEK